MLTQKQIGQRLKALRKSAGYSVEQVCEDCEIGQSSYEKYEAGFRNPRDEIKRRLAEYYGVTVESVFFAD